MKRALAVAAALVLAAGCAAGPARRAIWVWEDEAYAMVNDPGVARGALAFLARKHVTAVYLYAGGFEGESLIERHPERYRALVRALHGAGLRAEALLGSSYLHTEEYVLPDRHADGLAMVRRVLDYNAAAAPSERFDGVSLDIEPHALPDWSRRRAELLADFMDLGQAVMQQKRESGQALQIGAAIPFWLDGIPVAWHGATRPASEHLIDLFDYVALMDYRDRADGSDGIIANAWSELQYARARGRRVVIGVEISPGEGRKVTFADDTEADLERELARVDQAFGDNRAFGGIAIHHYRSYRSWLERQGR